MVIGFGAGFDAEGQASGAQELLDGAELAVEYQNEYRQGLGGRPIELVTCDMGALDANALFYLQSRGLDPAEAQALLTRSFLAAAFADLDEEAAERLTRLWRETGKLKIAKVRSQPDLASREALLIERLRAPVESDACSNS